MILDLVLARFPARFPSPGLHGPHLNHMRHISPLLRLFVPVHGVQRCNRAERREISIVELRRHAGRACSAARQLLTRPDCSNCAKLLSIYLKLFTLSLHKGGAAAR